MSNRPSRYYVALLGITLLAFTVRMGCTACFLGWNAPPKAEANPDQVEYELFGWRMAAGQGYTWGDGTATAARTPGTSLSLVPVYVLFGRSYGMARIWFCLLSSLTCLAIGWAARASFGSGVGLVSATLLALYPGHFYYAMHFLSEPPFALFLVLAVGCAARAVAGDGDARYAGLAGLFWGFSVLTRPQMVLAIPIVLFFVSATPVGRRRRYATLAAVMVVALMLVLAPWLMRNARVLGRPTLSTLNGSYTLWGGNNEYVLNDPQLRGSWIRTSQLEDAEHPLAGGELERDDAAYRYAWAFICSHWYRMPELCLYKMLRILTPFTDTDNRVVYWTFALAWMLLAPFALVGVVLAFRENRTAAVVFLIPVLATVGAALIFYGLPRFRDSVAPLLATFAAVAIIQLWGALRSRLAPPAGSETVV